jgi:hypothetical protein
MTMIVFDREPEGTPYDRTLTLTEWRLVGGAAYPTTQTGLRAPARTFDGTAAYEATDEAGALVGVRAITVRALVRPDFVAGAGLSLTLASRGQGGPLAAESRAWQLRLSVAVDALSADVQWVWQDETGTPVVYSLGTIPPLAADAWMWISATRETVGGTSYMRLSVNGVDFAEVTATDQIPATPGQPVLLGARKTAASWDQFFIGDMEQAEVLAHAVTPLQERHRALEILELPDTALDTVRAHWFQEPVKLYESVYADYRLKPIAAMQATVDASLLRRQEALLPPAAYAEQLVGWELALGLDPTTPLTLAERQARAASAITLADGIGAESLLAYARRVLADPTTTLIEKTNDVQVTLSHTIASSSTVIAPAFEQSASFVFAPGSTLDADGDFIVEGDPFESSGPTAGTGRIHIVKRDPVTNTYALDANIENPAPVLDDNYGFSVAISGDTVVVGTPRKEDGAKTDAGSVYVLRYDGAAWNQEAQLFAGNSGASDRFGDKVDIDGDVLVVGAPGEDGSGTGIDPADDNLASGAGAVYVFRRTGTSWAQEAYVKASNTGNGDGFGGAVSVSGDVMAVGAKLEGGSGTGINPASDNLAANAGAVYVFRHDGVAWAQEAYIKASNTGAGDQFGGAVDLHANTLVVGAANEASNATGIDGNQADNSAVGAGAVYVFRHDGAAWAQEAYVKASNTASTDNFGASVRLRGDWLVAGAPSEDSGIAGNQADNSASNAGAAYLFTRDGVTWAQQAYLKPATPIGAENFGVASALDDHGHVAVGSNNGAAWYLLDGCPHAMAGVQTIEKLRASAVEGNITTEWDGSALAVKPACPVGDLRLSPGSDRGGIADWGSSGALYIDATIEIVTGASTAGAGLIMRNPLEALMIFPYQDGADYKIRVVRWDRGSFGISSESSADVLTMPASATSTWQWVIDASTVGAWTLKAVGDADEVSATLPIQLDAAATSTGLATYGPESGGDPEIKIHAARYLWPDWPVASWTAYAPASTVQADVGADLLARRTRASARAGYSRIDRLLADDPDAWFDYTPTAAL